MTFTFPPFSFLIKPKQEKRGREGREKKKKDHVSQKRKKRNSLTFLLEKENTFVEKKLPWNEVEIFEYTVVNWICIH